MTFAKIAPAAFLVGLVSILAGAQEPGGLTEPAAVVDAFHAAMAGGDRDQALSYLDSSVVIFEAGGSERSRDEYAAHHLPSDIEFAKATKTTVLDRTHHTSGDIAWVLSRTRTTGRFRDREVDLVGVETVLLRLLDHRWTIVHIHWSSRRQAG